MKEKAIILNIILSLFVLGALGQEWQKPINTGTQGNSICFDNENNQYVTGEFAYQEPENMFKNKNLLDLTNHDNGYYFAKLNSNQEIQWLKVLEADWGFYNNKIKLDQNNDIIMVSNYLEGITIDSERHYDGDREWRNFIAKFSSDGKLKWIKYFGFSLIENFYIDSKNQIYITGHYQGTLSFNAQSNIYSQTIIGYYAKFDSDGEYLNSSSIRGSEQIESYAIVTDSLENVYIGGYIYGDAYFDTTYVYSKRTDQFIAKFDKNNNNIWVKHFGTTWNDITECIYSLSFDHTGQYLYAAGVIQGGTVAYDNYSLTVYDKNIFLGKFTLDGDVSWVKSFGNWSGAASYTEEAKCVAVDKNTGSVYINGTFQSTASFDTHSIKSLGNSGGSSDIDIFVARVDPTGKVDWAIRCGGMYEDRIYGLAIDYSGNPCISGQIAPFSDFGDYSLTGEYQFTGFFATISDTTRTTNTATATIKIKTRENEIKVYPTITQNYVYFENIKGDETITVCRLTGAIVSRSVIGKDKKIDITSLANGVYLLNIEGEGTHSVFKIIKD